MTQRAFRGEIILRSNRFKVNKTVSVVQNFPPNPVRKISREKRKGRSRQVFAFFPKKSSIEAGGSKRVLDQMIIIHIYEEFLHS